jgi:predicted  nucleic acid-binding Zn ribbon protein
MQVLSLEIDVAQSGFDGTPVEDRFWCLLGMLYDTRQIIADTHCIVRNSDRISVQVTVPEPDALTRETTDYVRQAWRDLETLTGKPIALVLVGTVIADDAVAPHAASPFYILRYGWWSPLICGATHKPIPLYRIPPTNPDGLCYDNMRFWENTYKRLYGLWLGSGVGEQFALKQMQAHDSQLSAQGRALCRRIEDLTGIPTYYFLFNYRGWSTAHDHARLCPETGNEWRIEGATASDFIAFKSDTARLVSELSTNCR